MWSWICPRKKKCLGFVYNSGHLGFATTTNTNLMFISGTEGVKGGFASRPQGGERFVGVFLRMSENPHNSSTNGSNNVVQVQCCFNMHGQACQQACLSWPAQACSSLLRGKNKLCIFTCVHLDSRSTSVDASGLDLDWIRIST